MTVEPPTPTPAPAPVPASEPAAKETKRGQTRLWVPIVLLVGLLVGVLVSYDTPSYILLGPFEVHVPLPEWFREQLILHNVLSTVSIALLVALAVIYARMYWQTRARFSLGITVVLLALLVESIIQYPLLLGHVGPFPQAQTTYMLYADAFTIVAYTVFLYLSLE